MDIYILKYLNTTMFLLRKVSRSLIKFNVKFTITVSLMNDLCISDAIPHKCSYGVIYIKLFLMPFLN